MVHREMTALAHRQTAVSPDPYRLSRTSGSTSKAPMVFRSGPRPARRRRDHDAGHRDVHSRPDRSSREVAILGDETRAPVERIDEENAEARPTQPVNALSSLSRHDGTGPNDSAGARR